MFSLFRTPVFLLRLALVVTVLVPLTKTGQAQVPAPSTSIKNGQEVESNNFTLRWIKPSRFIANLAHPAGPEDGSLLPAGLRRISSDDTTGRVFVQGTPESLARIQEISRLLDVDSRRVRLSVRILRAPADQVITLGEPGQKLRKGEVVSSAAGVFQNNENNTLYAFGDGKLFHIPLTPHINGDDTISLAVDLSGLPPSAFSSPASPTSKEGKTEPSTQKHTVVRRVQNGAILLAAAGPDVKNKDFAYYLEITSFLIMRQEP